MLEQARPKVKPYVDRAARLFIKVPPNWLSALGPVVAGVYFIFMVNGWYWAALVAMAGMTLDSLDGAVARLTGKETKFGAFWDATLDRLADMLLLAAFGASGLVSWGWVVAGIGFSFLISYTRAKTGEVSQGKVRLAVGVIERGERLLLIGLMTLMVGLGWLMLAKITFGVLVGLSILTVGQRVAAAKKAL